MGNASARRRSSVAETDCASGTYRRVASDQIRESCVETDTALSIRSSFSSLFKSASKRSSGRSFEAKVEAWPVTQTETLFLPLFPTLTHHKTKELTLSGDLADGAYGKVCKADEVDTCDSYAIKIISKSKVVKEDLVGCILQESEILKAVGHHPFIAQFVDCWQSRRKLFILTELVPCGELHALLGRYAIFPLLVVQLYIAQLGLALDFLHNAGVVYRDLKPENLLLDGQLNLKVVDFGLAKWLAYGARTRTLCGTPKYMAPEVWTGQPYGHAVDWWSLGVVACRMLTGQFVRLEPDPSPISQPNQVHLPDSVELDVPSKDLLLRLLELDTAKRLRSLRALQQIRFFYKFNFDDVENKRANGLELWKRFHPHISVPFEAPPAEDRAESLVCN